MYLFIQSCYIRTVVSELLTHILLTNLLIIKFVYSFLTFRFTICNQNVVFQNDFCYFFSSSSPLVWFCHQFIKHFQIYLLLLILYFEFSTHLGLIFFLFFSFLGYVQQHCGSNRAIQAVHSEAPVPPHPTAHSHSPSAFLTEPHLGNQSLSFWFISTLFLLPKWTDTCVFTCICLFFIWRLPTINSLLHFALFTEWYTLGISYHFQEMPSFFFLQLVQYNSLLCDYAILYSVLLRMGI